MHVNLALLLLVIVSEALRTPYLLPLLLAHILVNLEISSSMFAQFLLTICDFIFKTECLSVVDSLVSFMRSSIVLLSRGLTTALLRMDSVKLIPLD